MDKQRVEEAFSDLEAFIYRDFCRILEEDERRAIFRGDLLIGTKPRERRPCAAGSVGRLLEFPGVSKR